MLSAVVEEQAVPGPGLGRRKGGGSSLLQLGLSKDCQAREPLSCPGKAASGQSWQQLLGDMLRGSSMCLFPLPVVKGKPL